MIRVAWLALLALSACSSARPAPEAAMPVVDTGWHRIATDPDRKRLRNWRKSWVKALDAAKAAGHEARIDAEGALLQPDSALADVGIRPGTYRCRTIKLGARGKANLAYVDYPPFACVIGPAEGKGTYPFAKIDGSQRPVGRLFPDDSRRLVFLGTLQLGDEQSALRYGHDRARDMVGIFERIGPNRWRLAFPAPAFESLLDVVEITPAA